MERFIILCQDVTLSRICVKKIQSVGKTQKLTNQQIINYLHPFIRSSRLEIYEQSCAIDSVTKKCAGKMNSCRLALLGIMGTPLRTLCACQGSDLQQLYECLGWQRLLWLNPCVGKFKLSYIKTHQLNAHQRPCHWQLNHRKIFTWNDWPSLDY